MGTVSPLSLEQLCLNFICSNIEDLCKEVDEVLVNDSSFRKYAFKFSVVLHEQLADSIIRNLACSRKLNSKTATLFIDPSVCRIRKLCIKDADVDEAILKLMLSNHKISEVDLSGTSMISTSVFALLGGISSTLRTLNLSNAIHIPDFSALLPLTSLTYLDISNSAVDDTDLSLISQHLICLETINVSNTKVIKCESFGDLKDKLKVLLAYNSQVAWANPTDFKDFVSLQKLDISRNPESMSGYDWPMHAERLEIMLQDPQTMPELVYLDVSGSPRTLGKSLQVFLSSHPHLKFLGLCKTGRTCYSEFIPSEIKVTGEANEKQIIASLEMYPDRAAYMTDVLRRLFAISNNKRIETIAGVLQLVLPPMEKHSRDSRVQMAATACVFNLIRGSVEGEVHCSLLSKIASVVFKTMSVFQEKNEIARNCLLILESRQMLNKGTYNYFEGFRLAMDSLCYFLSDENIKKVATKLCASLSSRISTTETHALGTERNITTLLKMVQEKVSSNQVDFTLSMTLRTLWNLTDEAPSTSLIFVKKGGLQTAIQGLKVFREHPEEPTYVIIKKILGMLNNVAEVESLRQCLITEEFMAILGSLLEDDSIELTYFSGGILSNVVLSWQDNQTLNTYTKEQMLLKLENAVKGWNFPLEALVAYRSFSSFAQLLCSDMPAVNLWSLWGMLHVCSVHASRYVPLLISDGAIDIIQRLAESSPVREVKDLAHKLAIAVKKFQSSVKSIR